MLLLVVLLVGALTATVITIVGRRPVSATGVLAPETSTPLNFAGTGVITKLLVKPADKVVAGQVLAKQDDHVAQVTLAADEAVLAADKAALAQAEDSQTGATSTAVSAAQDAIRRDTSLITDDQQAITATVLTAPSGGIVSAVNGAVGEVASAQGVDVANPGPGPATPGPRASPSTRAAGLPPQPLSGLEPLIVIDSFALKVVAPISETEIHRAGVGDPATVTIPAFPGHSFPARVEGIQPMPVGRPGDLHYVADFSLELGTYASRVLPGMDADIRF